MCLFFVGKCICICLFLEIVMCVLSRVERLKLLFLVVYCLDLICSVFELSILKVFVSM